VPRTATLYTVFTFFWSCRVNYVVWGIFPKEILAPLRYIAVHVVEAPSVRWESVYGSGFIPEHTFLAVAIHGFTEVICCLDLTFFSE
jgi:hypothetical protein